MKNRKESEAKSNKNHNKTSSIKSWLENMPPEEKKIAKAYLHIYD